MSLAKKSLSIFLRDGFLFVSNAIISIILARSLGPQYLGLWFALNLIPSYAELFGRIKIDVAAVYYLSKGKYSLNEVLPVINTMAIFFSAVIVGIYLIFAPAINLFLFKEFANEMKYFAIFILMQIPLTFLYMNYLYVHIYLDDRKVVNRMALMRSLISFVIIIISYAFTSFNLNIISVMMATFAGILSALFYGIFKAPVHSFVRFIYQRFMMRDLFKYGIQLYITGIFSYLNVYVVQFLVLSYLIPIQMSYYTVAQQNSQLFQKLSDAVSVFLFPSITKNENSEERIELTLKVFRVLLTMLIPCLILAFLLLKPLVQLTYGVKYLPVIIPIFIILPAIVLSTATTPVNILFQSTGKPQLAYKSLIIPVIIQIIAGILFIPQGGILAAAACFALGTVTASLSQLYIFKREYAVDGILKKLFIKKQDVQFVWSFGYSLISKSKEHKKNNYVE